MLVRYYDIVEILSELDERYLLREKTLGVFDLVKLVLFILFIAHICGSMWHLLAIFEIKRGEKETWLGSS